MTYATPGHYAKMKHSNESTLCIFTASLNA